MNGVRTIAETRGPIITLTGNLLWEYTLNYTTWVPGCTQRAQADSTQPGGKGINVCRMLQRLDEPTAAWCFPGGDTGAAVLQWLDSRAIAYRAFPTSAPTRVATVIRSAEQAETTFMAPDRRIDATALGEAAAAINSLPDEALLVICGSFPGWDEPASAPLRTACRAFAQRGALVVDSYGPPLAELVTWPLAMLKINRDELHALTNAKFNDWAKKLSLRCAIITNGPHSIEYYSAEMEASRFYSPPHCEEARYPVGSGDVFLASLLKAIRSGQQLPFAVEVASSYGTANAISREIAEFPMNTLPELKSDV